MLNRILHKVRSASYEIFSDFFCCIKGFFAFPLEIGYKICGRSSSKRQLLSNLLYLFSQGLSAFFKLIERGRPCIFYLLS